MTVSPSQKQYAFYSAYKCQPYLTCPQIVITTPLLKHNHEQNAHSYFPLYMLNNGYLYQLGSEIQTPLVTYKTPEVNMRLTKALIGDSKYNTSSKL